jgi:hypothetical protein
MPADVGVLIVHGMGRQRATFADGLMRRLERRLGGDASRVRFRPCYWGDILQQPQEATWDKLAGPGRPMGWRLWRRWVTSSLGDPASYLSGYFKRGSPVYGDVHERLRASLESLALDLASPTAPLVILAHSLGSVIVTNYLWDERGTRRVGRTDFESGRTLAGLVTYGSNIPLFLPPPPVECITFPPPELDPGLRNVARWINIYAPADVLGYPLNDIWDQRHGTTITDLPIHAGPWPLSRTPLSHVLYQVDRGFLRTVLGLLRVILFASSRADPGSIRASG